MPHASRSKPKGGVQTTPKNVAATVKLLRRSAEAQQAALRHLLGKRRQKKNAEEARIQLAVAYSKLEEDKLDAEAILRQAERSGMQTRSLKEAIEFASECLSSVPDAPRQGNPPNPEPDSRISDEPDPPITVEDREVEDSTELNSAPVPVPVTGESREDIRRAGRAKGAAGTAASKFKNLRTTRSNPAEEDEEDEDEIVPESMSRSGAKSKNLTRSKELTESTPSKSKPPKAARPDPNSFEKLGEGDEEEEFLVTKSRAGTKTKV